MYGGACGTRGTSWDAAWVEYSTFLYRCTYLELATVNNRSDRLRPQRGRRLFVHAIRWCRREALLDHRLTAGIPSGCIAANVHFLLESCIRILAASWQHKSALAEPVAPRHRCVNWPDIASYFSRIVGKCEANGCSICCPLRRGSVRSMGFFWLGVGQAVPDDSVFVILVESCQALA